MNAPTPPPGYWAPTKFERRWWTKTWAKVTFGTGVAFIVLVAVVGSLSGPPPKHAKASLASVTAQSSTAIAPSTMQPPSTSALPTSTEPTAPSTSIAPPTASASAVPHTQAPVVAPTHHAALVAPPSTTHTSAKAAPPATHAAAPAPTKAAAASCHPLSNGGNCYEPGEFCRKSDHGASGVAGDGEAITCEDNDGWRWEPS